MRLENLPQLKGPNVCDLYQRLDDKSNETLIRNCCPGFEASLDKQTCQSKMEFFNPFRDSDNFTLALICIAVLLLIISILSSFIAYRYYYRYRLGRKRPGILTEEEDGHEDNFVIGFSAVSQHFDDNPYKSTMVH